MVQLFAIFYWVFSIITIITAGTGRKIRSLAKPMTMPLLGVFYILGTGIFGSGTLTPEPLVLTALGFSTLGDLLLLKQKSKKFFLAGLFAFLAGHLSYTAYFLGSIAVWRDVPPFVWGALVIYFAGSFGILKLLSGRSRILRVPVVIYIIILCGMNFATLLRIGTFAGGAFWWPVIGSLFYMISDSLLGIRNFKKRIPYISKVISITYHLAQFLIIFGILRSYLVV